MHKSPSKGSPTRKLKAVNNNDSFDGKKGSPTNFQRRMTIRLTKQERESEELAVNLKITH